MSTRLQNDRYSNGRIVNFAKYTVPHSITWSKTFSGLLSRLSPCCDVLDARLMSMRGAVWIPNLELPVCMDTTRIGTRFTLPTEVVVTVDTVGRSGVVCCSVISDRRLPAALPDPVSICKRKQNHIFLNIFTDWNMTLALETRNNTANSIYCWEHSSRWYIIEFCLFIISLYD